MASNKLAPQAPAAQEPLFALRQRPGHGAALAFLLLGLLSGVWATGKWGRQNIATADVPLASARSVQVRVWTRPSVRVVDHHVYHEIAPQPFDSAGVEIRYRAGAGSTRLAAVPLPLWPLALLTVAASIGLLCLPGGWLRRRGQGMAHERS